MVVARASMPEEGLEPYRDILAAVFDYCVREGSLPHNPLAEVKRKSKKLERQMILRRDDFHDRDEIDRLLEQAPSIHDEAFWLLGCDAGSSSNCV